MADKTDLDAQTSFASLACDIRDAMAAYEVAAAETCKARSRETDALNELNAAQKAFDSAAAKFRKLAPHSSAWRGKIENTVDPY